MISRHDVFCPGCSARITLRIGIGHEERQPFFFVCNSCRAVTKGSIVISKKDLPAADFDLPKLDLFLEEARLADQPHEQVDDVITIDPEYPTLVDTDEVEHLYGSPFIRQAGLMGMDGFQAFQRKVGLLRNIVSSERLRFQRLGRYYLDRNWTMFDQEGRRIFEEEWVKPENDFECHDMFHKVVDLVFMPMMVPDSLYPDLKMEHNKYVVSVNANNKRALIEYIAFLHKSGNLKSLQSDLLARLFFILDNLAVLLPALAMNMYLPENKANAGELRVFRDEFPSLKTHYIDSFELCHKVLSVLVGYINIANQGAFNKFPPAKPKGLKLELPSDMDHFKRLSSFNKANLLDSLPSLGITDMPLLRNAWTQRLDRNLRNDIGHHSIRHELSSGILVSDEGVNLPYADFLCHILEITPMLVLMQHILKMVYIVDALKQE